MRHADAALAHLRPTLTLRASDVLRVDIAPKGRSGVWFLNWEIHPRGLPGGLSEAGSDNDTLDGPCLYAVAFDGELICVDSYVGRRGRSHGNVVSERWCRLLESLTARGHGLRVSRASVSALEYRLGADHPMVKGMLQAAAPSSLEGVSTRSSVGLPQLLFAARHADLFLDHALDPQAILSRFTFVCVPAAEPDPDRERVSMSEHLRAAEERFIRHFAPDLCDEDGRKRFAEMSSPPLEYLGKLLAEELAVQPPPRELPLDQYLKSQPPEPMPKWLKDFKLGDGFDRAAFFKSRIVYYPEAGSIDGHPVELFGPSRLAHTFIFVDDELNEAILHKDLRQPGRCFAGYRAISLLPVDLNKDLAPLGWKTHREVTRHLSEKYSPNTAKVQPYALLAILEREVGSGDTGGPERLAALFIGGEDGSAIYSALYCQQGSPPAPYVIVVEDRVSDTNFDRLGDAGLLHYLSEKFEALPRWLLVGVNTYPWRGYIRVAGVAPSPSGHARVERHMFYREDALATGA